MTEPSSDVTVGVLGKRGRFNVVEPLFERGKRITVENKRDTGAQTGDIVVVRAGRRPGDGGRLQVIRSVGRPEVARDVVEALLVDRGYRTGFSRRASAEAQGAADRPAEVSRRDLTAMPTFTIDPAAARDFDDAISIERAGDGVRLFVHIADVAAHVEPGGSLDSEARQRGNSVYVPGAVDPMLPEALSNEACSLVPMRERPAFTAEIELAGEGTPLRSSFYRSTICSDLRLDYDQVDQIFAGRQRTPEPVAGQLELARKLAEQLRVRRARRGALTLETSEPAFEFDEHGHVRASRDEVQTEAHGLIEEFMILANEQVAETLERGRHPTIYRVHDKPSPAAVELLVSQLESLGVPTPGVPKQLTPAQANELVGRISATVVDYLSRTQHRSRAISLLVLRALQQAVYSATNIGHSGLASPCYTHFTSPIRRYPDLAVHRSLLAALEGQGPQLRASELEQVAEHCSQTERAAADTEHSADDICLGFLLEKVLYEQGWDTTFEGEVSGLTEGAAFITFGPLPGGGNCEGFLPARKLRDDWYDLNEVRTALIGRERGKTIRIGDPVSVKVRSVEAPRGRIDLDPARERD